MFLRFLHDVRLKAFSLVLKIFSCTRIVGWQKFVQYIHMLYLECFILVGSVRSQIWPDMGFVIFQRCSMFICILFIDFVLFYFDRTKVL